MFKKLSDKDIKKYIEISNDINIIKGLKEKYGKEIILKLLEITEPSPPLMAEKPNNLPLKEPNKKKFNQYTHQQKKDIINNVKSNKEFAEEFGVKPNSIIYYRKIWKKEFKIDDSKKPIKPIQSIKKSSKVGFKCSYCQQNPVISGDLCEECRQLR